MDDDRKLGPQKPRKKKRPQTGKPEQRPPDPVDEASTESFPASDPPAHSATRPGPMRPAGENPEKPGKR